MLIVASLGIKISEERLRKIILSGADVLRFNLSHHDLEKNIRIISMAQGVIDNLSPSVKNLIDFPINKPRLGYFDPNIFAVQEHTELVFQSASYSPNCSEFLPVDIPKLGEVVNLDQVITLADGEISIRVIDILSADSIKAVVLNNGTIRQLKTFNINAPAFSDDKFKLLYTDAYNSIKKFNPGYIAVSYVNREFSEWFKNLASPKKQGQKIVVKIERHLSVIDLEEICGDRYYDMILIDRGELGVNMPFERVGTYQKQIMDIANKFNKPVLVSTQLLTSTINNYIPNRSEILDITNIVLDGAMGVVFGHETGAGSRPAYTIAVAKKIIEQASNYKESLKI